jgi:hypothetical protein
MNFTFDSIKTSLINKLKEYSNWKLEILNIGVYSTILDIVSYILEKMAYYVDFLFIETTYNATLRSSIVRLALDHGYIPLRKNGSIGYLVFGTDSTFLENNLLYSGVGYVINKWTQFQNEQGDVTFYCTRDTFFYTNTYQKNLYPVPNSEALNINDGLETGIQINSHGLVAGDLVYITGTTFVNGIWALTNNTTLNRIVIPNPYKQETFTGLENIKSGYAFIPIKQGDPKVYNYIGIGTLNEKIPLYSDSIDQENIEVFLLDSNENIISQIPIVEDLYYVNQTDTYTCQVENFSDYTGVYIKFGDNITSKQLISGDRIQVKYSVTQGLNGNVKSLNIVNTILSSITNFEGNTEIVYVTNIESIIGGTDLETLNQIKKQYARLYSTSKQLTRRESWVGAIEEKQYVYRAIVWTELDLGQITLNATIKQNLHYITAVNSEGNSLTPSQENDITTNILNIRKSPTDIVSWQPLNKIKIKFSILAEINNTINFSDMRNRIISQLQNEYGILNLEFAQNIFESNYIRVIDLIQDVIRHETTGYYVHENVEFVQSETIPIITTNTSSSLNDLDKIIVVQDSFEIWIRRKINDVWYNPLQIANANGINISGTNTFTTSGTITYVGNETSTVNYSCIDVINNVVPFVSSSGTTTNSSQNITNVINIANIKAGMYASGINIVSNSKVLSVSSNTNTVVLDIPTNSIGASGGNILFSWFPDPKSNFGSRNPDDTISKGYVLYFVYQTRDGEGNRIGDIRLSSFNQILDFSEEMSEFNFIYGK